MTAEDYKELNIEEVLKAVENGDITAEQALEFEKQGKNRKTLIEALEGMMPAEDATNQNEKQSYTLAANVKYGEDRFKAGYSIELSSDEYELFVKAGLIQEKK